ncbi:MAG: hypothetical protein R3E32_18555 [Chitinophagales bacterium]
MKKYLSLIFCILLSVCVGTSCKSSDTTGKADSNAPAKTAAPASGDATTLSPEKKEEIESRKAAKTDEQVTSMMMKRAEALGKTYCNCIANSDKERCDTRVQKSYDATLKRLAEDKHAEFKATYDAIVNNCK